MDFHFHFVQNEHDKALCGLRNWDFASDDWEHVTCQQCLVIHEEKEREMQLLRMEARQVPPEPETVGEAANVAFGSAEWFYGLPMINPDTGEVEN